MQQLQAYVVFKASLYSVEALVQIGKALQSEGAVGKSVKVLKDAARRLKATKQVSVGKRFLAAQEWAGAGEGCPGRPQPASPPVCELVGLLGGTPASRLRLMHSHHPPSLPGP